MNKTSVFTTCTPLPAGITRQSVLDTYHNHVEMIELNPLVIEKFQCKPPSHAPAEEFYSTWYTIKDKVSYLPGGLATSSVSYHACFHNLPDGLQTHVYAPLGLDIRAKWSVGGSMPGEPKAPVELGLDAPRDGLYIREDVKMKCNFMMLSFVKKTFKESHGKLVDRLVEKAHMLEAKAANERLNQLKTVDPRERSSHGEISIAPPPGYQSPPQQSGHLSMYGNGSAGVPSPLNSPNFPPADPSAGYHGPGTPPYHLQQQQQQQQQQQRDYRVSVLQPNDQIASQAPEYLSNKKYEPGVPQTQVQHQQHAYNPHAYQPQQPSTQYSSPAQVHRQPPQSVQSFPAELPTEASSKGQQSFSAELPA